MKQYIFTGLLGLVAALTLGFTVYNEGRIRGVREVSKPAESPEEKPVLKTDEEAWFATKLFVAAAMKNGHTASFRGQRASDVVRRTGNQTFVARAVVWTLDDGRITSREFECEMEHLEAGKWRGNLTLTEDRKAEPKPSGEVI